MPLGGPDRHPLDQGIRGGAVGETAGIATRGSWAPKTACESGFERSADRSMFEMRASGLELGPRCFVVVVRWRWGWPPEDDKGRGGKLLRSSTRLPASEGRNASVGRALCHWVNLTKMDAISNGVVWCGEDMQLRGAGWLADSRLCSSHRLPLSLEAPSRDDTGAAAISGWKRTMVDCWIGSRQRVPANQVWVM